MHTSYSGCCALVRRPSAPASSSVGRRRGASRRRGPGPAGGRRPSPAARSRSRWRLGVALDVVPAVGHVVAGEERLDLVAAVGPAVPDHPDVGGVVGVGPPPVAEQVVDDRVEPLLGRVPRLEQVVVEADVVDRLDRDVGVGVRGEQQELRARARACAPARASRCRSSRGIRWSVAIRATGWLRSASLASTSSACGARGRPDDPVVGAVAGAQVAGDRRGDLGSSSTVRMVGLAHLVSPRGQRKHHNARPTRSQHCRGFPPEAVVRGSQPGQSRPRMPCS